MFPRGFGRRQPSREPPHYYDSEGRKVRLPDEIEEPDENGKFPSDYANKSTSSGSRPGRSKHSEPGFRSGGFGHGDAFDPFDRTFGPGGESPRYFRFWSNPDPPFASFGNDAFGFGGPSSSRFGFFGGGPGFDDGSSRFGAHRRDYGFGSGQSRSPPPRYDFDSANGPPSPFGVPGSDNLGEDKFGRSGKKPPRPYVSDPWEEDLDFEYLDDDGHDLPPRSSYRRSEESSTGSGVRFGDGNRPGDHSPSSDSPGSFRPRTRRVRRKPNTVRVRRYVYRPSDTPDVRDEPSRSRRHSAPVTDDHHRSSRHRKHHHSRRHTSGASDIAEAPSSSRRHHRHKHHRSSNHKSSSNVGNDRTDPVSHRSGERHHRHRSNRRHTSPSIFDVPNLPDPAFCLPGSPRTRKRRERQFPDLFRLYAEYKKRRQENRRSKSRQESSSKPNRDSSSSRLRENNNEVFEFDPGFPVASNAPSEPCDQSHRSKDSPFTPRSPCLPHEYKIKRVYIKPGKEAWCDPNYVPGSARCICLTCTEGHNRSRKNCVCSACKGASSLVRPVCECGHHQSLCTWVVYCADPSYANSDLPPMGTRMKCRECRYDVVKVDRASRKKFGFSKYLGMPSMT